MSMKSNEAKHKIDSSKQSSSCTSWRMQNFTVSTVFRYVPNQLSKNMIMSSSLKIGALWRVPLMRQDMQNLPELLVLLFLFQCIHVVRSFVLLDLHFCTVFSCIWVTQLLKYIFDLVYSDFSKLLSGFVSKLVNQIQTNNIWIYWYYLET